VAAQPDNINAIKAKAGITEVRWKASETKRFIVR
jgi:hypothetical protein